MVSELPDPSNHPQDQNQGHPLLEAGAQETQPKAHLSPLQPTSCPHPVPCALGNPSNPGIQVADASLPCPWLHAQPCTGTPPSPPCCSPRAWTFSKMSPKGPGRPGWG